MSEKKPPPYFPQTSLSPTDPHRYKKFKLVIGLLIFGFILLLAGAGIGIYYLISYLIS